MLRTDFEYLLQEKILVVEGNLSYEIQKRTKVPVPFVPRTVLDQPELVRTIHGDFAAAGADVLVAGTAYANKLMLEREGLADHLEEVNRSAIALAREACKPGNLLFAGIGSTGALLKPYGQLSEEDYREVYRNQAEMLMDVGIDGFILEGLSSLIEADQCILALREVSALPIVATMTFLEDGLTKFGDTMDDCFRSMKRKGADITGIHGTLGPLEIDEFLGRLNQRHLLCVRPNAGYPVRLGNTTTYLSAPDYVAEFAEMFVDKGARLVGGAAGFTPEHIAAVANRLKGRVPPPPMGPAKAKIETVASGSSPGSSPEATPKRLAQKLGREPVLSVELEPPKGLDTESILTLLERLQPYGIDAVNIPENPLARARISSIALAKAIFERTGIDSIAHVTCRDRNLISLQAELLGAHVLGINTILALTGDPAGIGDYPTATSVFDVDSLGLVEIMNRMNLGKDFGMNDLGSRTNFTIGIAANPLAKDLEAEVERVHRKIQRGAMFIQTQPIFDPEAVQPFLQAIKSFEIPVIFGVMLIRNYRHAKFLINEYPGIFIQKADLERFEKATDEAQAELSVAFARDLAKSLSELSGGVYLMPGFGEADRLTGVVEALRA